MDPTILTFNTRYPTMKIAFMLEKVQMTPDLLGSVIRLTARTFTFWTDKFGTFLEIYPDIKTLFV
jgi:hypothetical protein